MELSVENRKNNEVYFMRYYGTVKWFGGYNHKTNKTNDFGFIQLDGDIDLPNDSIFVHRRDVICDPASLKPDTLVSFGIDASQKNRIKAKEVKLLEEECDPALLLRCFNDSSPWVWLPTIKNLARVLPLDKGIEVVETKLKKHNFSNAIQFEKYIPNDYFKQSRIIRGYFPVKKRYAFCFELLRSVDITQSQKNVFVQELSQLMEHHKLTDETLVAHLPKNYFLEYQDLRTKLSDPVRMKILVEQPFDHIEELSEILKNNRYLIEYLQLLPEEVLFEHFWLDVPDDIKFDYFVDCQDIRKNIEHFVKIISGLPDKIRYKKLSMLREDWKQIPELFQFLNPVDKVKQMSVYSEEKLTSVWAILDYKTKLFYIFYLAKERPFPQVPILADEHPLVDAAKAILFGHNHAVEVSNQFIQDYVLETAWHLDNDIEILPLLPVCDQKYVQCCEGRPWPANKDGQDFCPRTKKGCDANIRADLKLPWYEWSLLELIQYAGLKPQIDGIKDPLEYVPRLGGWINRLEEIRERLRCTSCGKVLINRKSYAKNLAVYNSTVFYCTCGDPDNANVYISHCWACREIIDSRKAKIKPEDYYLCLYCGSGSKKSAHYRQGDVCPKCGSNDIKPVKEESRNYKCNTCEHKIRIPSDDKLTGKA